MARGLGDGMSPAGNTSRNRLPPRRVLGSVHVGTDRTQEGKMADEIPSQARFIGGLAIAMMIFAIAFAVFVLIAANMTPA
jgi:hypothetical protein